MQVLHKTFGIYVLIVYIIVPIHRNVFDVT